MDTPYIFLRFGAALFIGVLIGLQRQFASDTDEEIAAGVRTFAFISLSGCASGFLSDLQGSPLPLVVALLVLGILLGVSYYLEARHDDKGMTTEAAAFLTALVGAICYYGDLRVAVALGVAATALLSLKIELHRFAERLERTDLIAVLKFAVITAIILPVLPNQPFGPEPFKILNPFKIWLLVIFISGISFVGYVLIQLIGPRKGINVTGFLGGVASSTALTLSFTQQSRTAEALSRSFASAIIIAWTVMFLRVLVEVAVVNITLIRGIWLPLLAAVAVGLIFSFYLYRAQNRELAQREEEVAFSNPFELGPAIKFGLIYTVVLLISKAGAVYFGDTGLYVSSFVSGLADVDAIALSVAELSSGEGGVDLTTASRAIVIAAIANTLAKGGIVLFLGSPALRRVILPGYLLIMLTCALVSLL